MISVYDPDCPCDKFFAAHHAHEVSRGYLAGLQFLGTGKKWNSWQL